MTRLKFNFCILTWYIKKIHQFQKNALNSFSVSSSLGKNYPQFLYPKLIPHNLSYDILHPASLSKRLQWYEEEEKRTTYIFYAWMSATTLLFLSLVLWRICLSNMRKQTNKQKLFVKCLWMNWLIATNIYNVNKNAWGNIYIAEKKTLKPVPSGLTLNYLYILAKNLNSGLSYLITTVILEALIIYCFLKSLPILKQLNVSVCFYFYITKDFFIILIGGRSTFCQLLYHRKCKRRGVVGQKSQIS